MSGLHGLFRSIYGVYEKYTPDVVPSEAIVQQDSVWAHVIPFGAVSSYLLMIVLLPRVQRRLQILIKKYPRKDGELVWEFTPTGKAILFSWNLTLSTFSVVSFLFCLCEFAITMYEGNEGFFLGLTCPSDYRHFDPPHSFWYYIFVISKYAELLDTFFLLMKNPDRKPSLLHWFHHCTVLLLAWYAFRYGFSGFEIGALLNTLVHSIMYFYYALAIYVPQTWGMFITVLQIAQMVAGLLSSIQWSILVQSREDRCGARNYKAVVTSCAIIYLSYLVLFLRFFAYRYLCKKSPKKTPTPDPVEPKKLDEQPAESLEAAD